MLYPCINKQKEKKENKLQQEESLLSLYTLETEGITHRFVEVDQDTRINVKIKADSETEINGSGPEISNQKLSELKEFLTSLSSKDTVVFAGSSPKNLGNIVYKELIGLTRKTGAQVVCDFEGQTLLDSLDFEPLLVKPNNHELGDIFGVKLENLDQIESYARQILEKGAQHVIIALSFARNFLNRILDAAGQYSNGCYQYWFE